MVLVWRQYDDGDDFNSAGLYGLIWFWSVIIKIENPRLKQVS